MGVNVAVGVAVGVEVGGSICCTLSSGQGVRSRVHPLNPNSAMERKIIDSIL